MPVVFLIAVIAVLTGVFFAATGRGGELAYERVDHAPLDLGPVSAPDVAMLRPPTAMWGYNMQVTDEALDRIARAMRDRDVTIAYLQQQLADRVSAGPGALQVRQTAEPPAASEALRAATEPWQTLPGSYDAQGPQGAYDTHGWWAQQEEAAREEEARRQAAAEEAGQALPDQADPPEASAPGPTAPEASATEASASEAGSPSGRIGTLPNPVIASPGGTATSSGHGDQPTASSVPPVPPVPPDDDTVAAAEEQGW